MVNLDRKKWVLPFGVIAIAIIFSGIVLSEYLCRNCPQVPDPASSRIYSKGWDGHQVYLTFAESVTPTFVWTLGGLAFIGLVVYNRSINTAVQRESGWERYERIDD
jgi:hypothetical protein